MRPWSRLSQGCPPRALPPPVGPVFPQPTAHPPEFLVFCPVLPSHPRTQICPRDTTHHHRSQASAGAPWCLAFCGSGNREPKALASAPMCPSCPPSWPTGPSPIPVPQALHPDSCWHCVRAGLTLSPSHCEVRLHPQQARDQEKSKEDQHFHQFPALEVRGRATWSAQVPVHHRQSLLPLVLGPLPAPPSWAQARCALLVVSGLSPLPRSLHPQGPPPLCAFTHPHLPKHTFLADVPATPP